MALTRLGTNAITTVPNSAITLDAAEIPNLDAAKITTGTLADARISASSVTQHSAPTDLQPIKSDISALALREATNESSAAFNLPNQFIETFTDDTNLGTQTTGDRVDGYWGTVTESFSAQAAVAQGTGTVLAGDFANRSAAAFDGTTGQAWNVGANTGSGFHSGNTAVIGKDWGSGNAKYITGFKFHSSSNDGVHSNGNNSSGCSLKLIGHTSDAPASGTVLGTLSGLNFRLMSHEFSKLDITRSTSYRYHWIEVIPNTTDVGDIQCSELVFYEDPVSTSANATGTLIQSANAVGSAKTKVGGTMLYKDNEGTATLGTDLKIYFSCDGGSNWTEATSYSAITPVYSTGVKQVRLGETTCTSGTDVRYKAVWANQSEGSKETQLHGIGVNY